MVEELSFLEDIVQNGTIQISAKETGDIVLFFEEEGYLPFILRFSKVEYEAFCDLIAQSDYLYEEFNKATEDIVSNMELSKSIIEFNNYLDDFYGCKP